MVADSSGKLGLGALALGLGLILMGLFELASDWQFFRNAVSVEGTVWYTATRTDEGGRGVRVRVPVTAERTETWVLPYHVSKNANSTVTIAWPEGQPELARINSSGERLVVPLLYFAFGLPLLWASRWLRDDSMPDWVKEEREKNYYAAVQRELEDSEQVHRAESRDSSGIDDRIDQN